MRYIYSIYPWLEQQGPRHIIIIGRNETSCGISIREKNYIKENKTRNICIVCKEELKSLIGFHTINTLRLLKSIPDKTCLIVRAKEGFLHTLKRLIYVARQMN